MKIKFVANYDNDKNIYESIINCFKLSKEQKDYLTFKEDYDYLGIFNGYKNVSKEREKNVGFLQEPIGNINYDRNLHFYCSKIFCQSKDMFRPNVGINETNLKMFFSNHVDYSYLNFEKRTFKKEKKLCLFLSNLSHPNNPNWVGHNYTKRIKFLDKILKSNLEIDIYGKNLNLSDPRYKGSPHNKHEILKNYEFSIAIENCCEKNYVSEKFFDCVLNNVIPIYYGCPNVHEIFNNDCYKKINLEEEDVIEKIKDLIIDKNSSVLDSIIMAKNTYYDKFNPVSCMMELLK